MSCSKGEKVKARIMAYMIDHDYFDYGSYCKKGKNGHYRVYDHALCKYRNATIAELAEDYEIYAETNPELIEEAEQEMEEQQ